MIISLTFAIVFFLLAVGVPIAFAIFSGAIAGLWLIGGVNTVTAFFGYGLHALMASYPLAVAPLFILVGTLAEVCALGESAYIALHRLLGSVRGGLLMATTGAAALFGACCGSSVASASLFSRLALPELRKFGYQEEMSLGGIATAGGLAVLIPPSIAMVFYGILTDVSIGKVLIGGIIPGIILAGMIMFTIFIRVKLNPRLAPMSVAATSWREKFLSLIGIWPLLGVFVIIIGGIYSGFCTPTEAGAVGASLVLLYALARGAKVKQLVGAFREAAALTAQIFILVAGGLMLSRVVALSGITKAMLSWVVASELPLFSVWTIFIVICLILGAILDPVSMMVLTLPLTFPILTGSGVNPIALGIVVVLLIEVAVITPPIGFNVYVVAALAGTDPMVAFRGSFPFFIVLMVMIVIVILFPSISTWLPGLAYG